jgi:hypothetical protein
VTRVRVYLPVGAAEVAAWLAGAALAPPREAYAVTPALRATHPGADLEELEYAALVQAAAAAGRERGQRPLRRAIAAVDVASAAVQVDGSPDGRVRLTAPLARRDLAAVHVDELAGGDDDADLLWFDATELELVSAAVAAVG